jgi:putative transcriptional regulator
MTVHHHVPDDMLYLYAAGDMPHLWSLGVATHLAMCPHCRVRVLDFEEVLGAALDAEDATGAVGTDVRDLIRLAALEPEEAGEAGVAAAQPGARPVFPQPLRDVCGDLGEVRWSVLGGGVKQHLFSQHDGMSARLLYIPAGVAVPAHGHGGVEFTQVLSGGYFDGEQAFSRGDIQVVAHESPHQPIAMTAGPCICLAITDAPLRFRNIIPRLLQSFFRI